MKYWRISDRQEGESADLNVCLPDAGLALVDDPRIPIP
jgi:hypothetical protein